MRKLLLVLLLVVYPAYGQDYTVTQIEAPPLHNINNPDSPISGANANLSDDGMAIGINIGFDFEFYGNIFSTVNISNNGFITFTGQNSRCCNGNTLPAFGMDNSIMALWTDLISINNMNPYYKSYGELGSREFTVGWYNTLEYYNPEWTNTFEITLYEGSNNILFNYENLNVYQHTLTAGIQGTDGQSEQIYTGNSTQSLANSAYLFEYTPPEPPAPIAPDCTVNPSDISCIINTNTTPVYIAEENTNEPTQSLVADTTEVEPQVIGGISIDLESLLSSNESTEVADEEKEKELKDDITTDILEQVLATVETTETDRKDRNTGVDIEETTETIQAISVDETITSTLVSDNTETTEVTMIEETIVADNIIENNNVSEQVIEDTEVVENVETIVVVENQNNVVETNVETVIEDTETLVENITETNNIEETVEQTDTVELPVFVQNQSESTIENITIESATDETANEEAYVANQTEQSIAVDNEITNEILTSVAQATTDEETVESILVNVQGQQKTFNDEQTEDELLTMSYVQPGVFASITSYNVEPSISDKEIAGVLGKTEEKSDAEKRAEEVVAANKEQQEEINKNYMEADQSGILAAIGSDTDVSSYRSAMLRDNNIWYKPEDIYKNVVYKDNVRGAYFLEKGNTDTYKKMVEEQYK